MRAHGRPLPAMAGKATTLSSTMRSGCELVEDLGQPRMDVLRAVDEGLERRRDELAELLDGRLAEDRRGVADEVDPELAGDLGLGRRRAEAHQALLEALGLERPGERLLDDEHDPVATLAQHVADPDAVVGRAVGALGEEDDGARVRHVALRIAGTPWRSADDAAGEGRPLSRAAGRNAAARTRPRRSRPRRSACAARPSPGPRRRSDADDGAADDHDDGDVHHDLRGDGQEELGRGRASACPDATRRAQRSADAHVTEASHSTGKARGLRKTTPVGGARPRPMRSPGQPARRPRGRRPPRAAPGGARRRRADPGRRSDGSGHPGEPDRTGQGPRTSPGRDSRRSGTR